MIKVFLVGVCLGLFGCTNRPPTSVTSNRDEIIRIAKREIERRHIQLPPDCNISMYEGVTVFEPQGSREEYIVRFTFMFHGKREVFYKIVIDKRSKRINDFIDYRNTIPGGG
jgi:hypothetical protein